ncbi:MAG: winged helix DNA-binding domain-containing protein [Propionibacteriaceae bacterium]|jgi:uncharacterized protein YcaQ|nr:winged helix DNA-binding domain-containing protein [Propionibacteriaceae bacterium]
MSAALSIAEARRIALAAQGFGGNRAEFGGAESSVAQVGLRQVSAEINRVAQFQIDTVNVLVRAHYMPLYARLGAYDTALLTKASTGRNRKLFEYWGHAACLIDINLYPALRWRMEEAKTKNWTTLDKVAAEKPHLVDAVLTEIGQRGPLTQRQLVDAGIGERKQAAGWWSWGETKRLVEYLFYIGVLGVADRNTQFERRYDLIERVIPKSVYAQAALPKPEAQVELIRRAAAALGVATARGLGRYFYQYQRDVQDAINTLVRAGELEPVSVAGVSEPAYLWHQARRPRRITTATLVSPFDSLVFERRRLKQLFGVDYTIGLYTPKEQRDYGYYVYLLVLNETIAARVDLKADRAAGTLLVQAAWLEPSYATQLAEAHSRSRSITSTSTNTESPNHLAAEIVPPLAAELTRLATWLGMETITVIPRGDLATPLAAAV